MATRPILFAEHALLRFGGGLGADTWSCGIRLAGSPASSDTAFCEDNLDDAADAVRMWWTAFPQGVSAYFNGLANLAWVKLNAIDSAGRYQDTNNTNLVEIQPAIAPSGKTSLVRRAQRQADRQLRSDQRGVRTWVGFTCQPPLAVSPAPVSSLRRSAKLWQRTPATSLAI